MVIHRREHEYAEVRREITERALRRHVLVHFASWRRGGNIILKHILHVTLARLVLCGKVKNHG